MRLARQRERGFAGIRGRNLWSAIAFGAVVVLSGAPVIAQTVKEAVGTTEAINGAAKKSQQRIDKISDDTDSLAAEYRAALQEVKALGIYNKQLESLIVAQEEEMGSLREQIDNVTVVSRRVLPLLTRMLDTLEQFVSLDVPFLAEERAARIAALREMMGRADVTISEKYRRILEAYQIENEYGRTIEAYRGPVNVDGKEISVDFLRLGRIALLYQTLDAAQSGMWDTQAGAWVSLDDEYRNPIQEGLRMARKQTAPDLITVPLPAAKKAEVEG